MSALSEPLRDTWTVKTALRPDYYELFPRFSPEELDARLARLPFHRATLLTEWNVRTARTRSRAAERAFHAFLRQPPQKQRHRLADVLASVGIGGSVVAAIAAVPRHCYAPEAGAHLAYLNVHIPTGPGSCMTPPGLVAAMLERLAVHPGDTVVEFGAGSGYHLACAARLAGGRGRVVGVDIRDVRRRTAEAARLPLVLGCLSRPPLRAESADAVYATCSTRDQLPGFAGVVRPGGRLQCVTPISREEYEREPESSWLKSAFADYGDYLRADPQRYGCVRTYAVDGGAARLLDSLYDVSFVAATSQHVAPPPIRKMELR